MTTAPRTVLQSESQPLPTDVDEWPPHLQRMNQAGVDLRGEAQQKCTGQAFEH